MKLLDNIDKDVLEAYIDKHGLANVLLALQEICDGKAGHIAENWQDTKTAKQWTHAGVRLGVTATRVTV